VHPRADRALRRYFVQFACRAETGAATREIAIELPAGLDPAVAGGRIALRGVARDGDGRAAGPNLWIVAFFDSAESTLQVATSTTVLSDGTYPIATLPAAHHAASAPFEGGRMWAHEFTLPIDVTEARQDFALR